jgi:hypothetical protein
MHILLMYAGGREREGLLLAGSPERMRVMMPGQADAVEFRLIEGNWMNESGAAVEIGALAAGEPRYEEWMTPAPRVRVRVRAF